jgi:hypothetical protein
MSLETALFLIDRQGTNYQCPGSDLVDRIQLGDKVLVQRGAQQYYTWYGKPASGDTPYYTRRVRFNNQCFPNADGDKNDQHTDQPGEVNLSYWWGCGGPSPIREWRNIRNKNVSGFVDLDGQAFPLQSNPDVLLGSICRITSDAGWSSWHEIEFKGGNNGLGFKTQYTNDAGDRERTDLNVEGVENTYKPANGEILTFDFFDPASIAPFHDIEDDDLLLVWDGNKNWSVTGAQFESLFVVNVLTVLGNGESYLELDERTNVRVVTECPGATNLVSIYTRSDGFVNQEDLGKHDSYSISLTPEPGSWNFEWIEYKYRATYPDGEVKEAACRMRLLWYTDGGFTLEDAQECHRQEYADYQYCKLLCETDYCLSICDREYENAVKECYESRGFDVPARITPPPRV